MFRGVLWAENLTAFSNYMKLHVKALSEVGLLVAEFSTKTWQAKHMLGFAMLTCFWRLSGKEQSSKELYDTDVFHPRPHAQML